MIIFKSVRFKNFGSFGNYFTEIELDRNRTTLVSGSNGNGKSFALLDSITFGLFGRPFRKINIPQLVNTINEKGCLVEVEFSIGVDEYRICRGIKPKLFEIYKNNELLNQNAKAKDYQKFLEEQILKMNYKSFTQVVILGSSSFVPFMQLSASDRRAVIEDILDINVFSIMNQLLRGHMAAAKESIRDLDYRIDILKEKIEVQKEYIQSIKDKSEANLQRNMEEIERTGSIVEEIHVEIEAIKVQIKEKKLQLGDVDASKKKVTKLESLQTQLANQQKKVMKDISFFDDNDECPTCLQNIDKEGVAISKHLEEKNNKVHEIGTAIDEVTKQVENLTEELKQRQVVIEDISKLADNMVEKNSTVKGSQSYMKKLLEETNQIKSNVNGADNEKLQQYEETCLNFTEERKDYIGDMHLYDIASSLLKDSGIKAKIIKHYLPIMNKLINRFLTSMDFFANFTLDEEFNETIKSRHRDTFSYMSFSEGEKLRIDLALLMAWREIARLKNSANTNLLILDEVFDSSLDAVGTDEFLKLLHSASSNTHIFVISHKSDQLVDKFNASLGFEKKNNFSRIV
jgi:DNA repair exonuclease SbcCD ATPase subunit